MGSASGTVKAQPHDIQIYMYYFLSQIKQPPIRFFMLTHIYNNVKSPYVSQVIDAPRQNTE